MTRTIRTGLRLVVSIILLSAVALAATSHVDKNTNREHRSRFSKLAFWRGHKDHGAKTSASKNQEHHSRVSKLAFWRHHNDGDKSVKTAQANPASPKPEPAKAAQLKPAPHTTAAAKNGPTQVRTGKSSAKTSSGTTKGKAHKTAEDHTTASLKQ